MHSFVVDRLLPAAAHLTGPYASDVVGSAVASVGGDLHSLAPTQVLYRPGRELVVRYVAEVRWGGGAPTRETLFAGTTCSGEPPGTLPVEAEGLRAGVWRFPFDPCLPGLDIATARDHVADLLGLHTVDLHLELRSFRPLRRAVVHARWPGGEAYLKVLPPADAPGVVRRHELLGRHGLPVPRVVAVESERGVVATAALAGSNLRHGLLAGTAQLPSEAGLRALIDGVASIGLDSELGAGVPAVPVVRAAFRHAAMLRSVMPDDTSRLDDLVAGIEADAPVAEVAELAIVHGDLHDGQLQVHAGRVVGILDVDDVGPGDPLDDVARFVAHAVALALLTPECMPSLAQQIARLWSGLTARVDPRALNVRTAAALVGLATGPFRSQSAGWRVEVGRVLRVAEEVLVDERTLSRPSWASHV